MFEFEFAVFALVLMIGCLVGIIVVAMGEYLK